MMDERVARFFTDAKKEIPRNAESFTFEELVEFTGRVFPVALRDQATRDVAAGRLEHYEYDLWKRSAGVDNILSSVPPIAFQELTLEQVGRLVGSVVGGRSRDWRGVSDFYQDCRILAAHQKMGWDELLAYSEHISVISPSGQGLISNLADKGVPASYLADAGTDLSRYYNVRDIELAWRSGLPSEYLYNLPLMSREFTAGIIQSQFIEKYPAVNDYLIQKLRSHPYGELVASGSPSPTIMKVAMWMHGVTPEYAMATEPLSAWRIIECAKALVPAEYVRGLHNLTVKEVIGFWEADIPMEYAQAARSA